MGYWNSRGLRGSSFEEMINITNNVYKERGLAIIQKIPTPITPINLDKDTNSYNTYKFGQRQKCYYSCIF